MDEITASLKEHYSQTFAEQGPTAKGVDWSKEEDVCLRYEKMLSVIPPYLNKSDAVSLLDVGCGYGGLYLYARSRGTALRYTGIDVVEKMIEYAIGGFPEAEFYCSDLFEFSPTTSYDFVVCSGILTQKLKASILDMDQYAQRLIKKMFALCTVGVAFNVMTTKVNFMASNLYYRNPVEMFAYCLTEISEKIKIDHAYPLYEYTVYVYRKSV